MRLAALTMAAVMAAPVAGWAQTDERGAEVLKAAREAIGGAKVESVSSLSAEGPFRRAMGQRQAEGDIELLIAVPGKMRRTEEMSFGVPGGPTIERVSTLNGDESWDEMNNRGGGGPGGGVMMFRGGPGGPGGAGGPDGQRMGRDGQPIDEAAMAKARARRMQGEMQRWMFALLLTTDRPVTYVGTAEAPDGTADVIEITDERDQALRLFVDQQTHLPLMLTFKEVRPRMVMMGGPGGPGGRRGGRGQPPPDGQAPPADRPSPEEMRRRMEAQGPPPPVTVSMHFSDYQQVDGVLLPHSITQTVDNTPSEEWTVEKYKVNPKLKADAFEKK